MVNRDRCSVTTSSVSAGRWAMSTEGFLSADVRYMTSCEDLPASVRPAGVRPEGRVGWWAVGPPPDAQPPECSDAATLGGPAAVVGLRSDVLDRAHLEAGGLQGADRGLTAGAGTLDEDVDLLHAVLLGAARGCLSGELGGERRRLARPLEADLP